MNRWMEGLAMIASFGMLAGCAQQSTAADEAAKESLVASVMADIEKDESAWLPPGYKLAVPGIGFRWADDYGTEYDCPSYGASCFGVELVTDVACPSGVYIELALVDDAGTIRGMANEITPALAPGDHVAVGVSSSEESPHARLAQLNCM